MIHKFKTLDDILALKRKMNSFGGKTIKVDFSELQGNGESAEERVVRAIKTKEITGWAGFKFEEADS